MPGGEVQVAQVKNPNRFAPRIQNGDLFEPETVIAALDNHPIGKCSHCESAETPE
jgi:hypothetical protein